MFNAGTPYWFSSFTSVNCYSLTLENKLHLGMVIAFFVCSITSTHHFSTLHVYQ
jgi:hypothetical protein